MPYSKPTRLVVGGLLACVALVLALLSAVPPGAAQAGDGFPTPAEQQAAAADLIAQLDDITGAVDPSELTLDPALGPPPWLAVAPGRDPATIEAWTALAARLRDGKPATPSGPGARAFDALLAGPFVADVEELDETGLNDTAATGQFISGFGTGGGDEPFAQITGALGTPQPPEAPEPDCPSAEEDGAIGDANPVPPSAPGVAYVLCAGVLGDGAFGATSGDIDFFALGEVEAGSLMSVDVGSFTAEAEFSATTAIYNADGTLLASLDDADNTTASVLSLVAPATADYFAAVSGLAALPADPDDSSSGPGATTTGDYLLIVGIELAPEGPCVADEPDDTITLATMLDIATDEVESCTGVIGDGTFGATSGDFDVFGLAIDAETILVVDVAVPQAQAATPTTVAVYDSNGNIIATGEDDGTDPNHYVSADIESAGTYFVLVSSPGVLPSDPFDAGSGPGAGPQTAYTVLISPVTPVDGEPAGPPATDDEARQAQAALLTTSLFENLERLSPPCHQSEDDGSLGSANPAVIRLQTSVVCEGFIGDGPHSQAGGDFDIYAIPAVGGEVIVADIDAQALGGLDSFLTLYNERGLVVASNDDFDLTDSRIAWPVESAGTYYLAVSAFGSVQTDPFDSSSGSGSRSIGPYTLTLGRTTFTGPDVDVYLVDLDVGDAISAGFTTSAEVTILDPDGVVLMSTLGSLAFLYPPDSPLRFTGDVGVDHVSERAGTYAIMLSGPVGSYDGELSVMRSGLTDSIGDEEQIIYLDFDGGSFNDAIFDPFEPNDSGEIRTLSPLAATLSRWELSSTAEDAVIDNVVATFTHNLLHDMHDRGGNGNRDATGLGGELDVTILNSRDHEDPWGQPNVSRIIVGGTRTEAGINAMGIAQSVDPGNFDTEETAIVLLDILSEPAGGPRPSLNDYALGPTATKAEFVGHGIARVAAHEAGHLIGNFHTEPFNGVLSLMDDGSDVESYFGLGPDLTYGTADDVDTVFTADAFARLEGALGLQDTRVRVAQGLSTGQASVEVIPELDGPPDGTYYLRSESTGRLLSGSSESRMVSSALPTSVERWALTTQPDGSRTLRNLDLGTFLAGQGSWQVEQVPSPGADAQWQLEAFGDGSFYLTNVERDRSLSARRIRLHLSTAQTSAQRWTFEALSGPDEPTAYVGETVAIQSNATAGWLTSFPYRNADQSLDLAETAEWQVLDAGSGHIYLRNVLSGRYLDAGNRAGDGDVRTSLTPRGDDRWLVIEGDGFISLRNALTGGYLTALDPDSGLNVIEGPIESLATEWQVIVDPLAG